MPFLHVLYEHATGYALFRTLEYEEIGMLQPQVEKSVHDVAKFKSIVQLVAFSPFKNATNALDNINSISEGIVHQDLQLLLETNVPKSKKKVQVILGVGDMKIGAAIQEALGISCQHTGVVPEIMRGIRCHFPNLVKGLTSQSAFTAQLGLGHSYSRAKVKFNVNKMDNMIIQSISLLDQLDKDINTFSMRIREWYSYHFPELIKIVPDNYLYAKVTKILKNRKEISEEAAAALEEALMDSAKSAAVIEAARTSMGMDISPIDLLNIEIFAGRVIALADYRKQLMEYLKSKMHNIAPNLAALIGETVGARLISQAGSLTNLAKYPASTVQILGAEKALFRALKTRGNTPKYGLIFHSSYIGKAGTRNKGRISRYLANKCSIASRIDCFSEIPTEIFGNKLKLQVEERLKFYESGDLPRKNADVMQEAVDEAEVIRAKIVKKKKKKAKKDKMSLEESQVTEDTSAILDESVVENSFKKKKKKRHIEEVNGNSAEMMDTTNDHESPTPKKKKKKKHNDSQLAEDTSAMMDTTTEPLEDASDELVVKKKKKKKQKASD